MSDKRRHKSDSEIESWYTGIPDVGTTVMFTTQEVGDTKYTVTLDEYSDMEAFIDFSHISSRKIKKPIPSILKPRSKHCASVI